MTMTLYVANLPVAATPADLWELFLPYGRVAWAAVRRDRPGFPVGVVDMASGGSAAAADLNDRDYRGRRLAVSDVDPDDGAGPDWVV